jgi:hypothetical protein
MTHSNLMVLRYKALTFSLSFEARVSEQNIGNKMLPGSRPRSSDRMTRNTLSEFRNLAWTTANETARKLGWIRSCEELHRAEKARVEL